MDGKSRGGRPRKSQDVRDMTVSCRVTQGEWHYLDGLARKHGRSLNDLLRSLILAGMPHKGVSPFPPPSTAAPSTE
jgi:hypothetical protein